MITITRNIRNIRRSLKKDLLKLRKKYASSLSDTENGIFEDNYYMFEREGKALTAFLHSLSGDALKNELARLLPVCEVLTPEGKTAPLSEIGSYTERENVSVCAYEYLNAFFKIALIHCAAANPDNEKIIGNAVRSLRNIEDIDFADLAAKYNKCEKLLLTDSTYAAMPPEVKSVYRKRVMLISFKEKISECEVAEKALSKGEHIGFFLLEQKNKNNKKYLIFDFLLPAALSFVICAALKNFWLFILIYFPLWQITTVFTVPRSMKNNPPKPILRLDAEMKIPDEGRTLITVSSLLPNAKQIPFLEKRLTELYRANCGDNLKICLLADKKGFSSPSKPDDKTDLYAVKKLIGKLNDKYSGGFILAVRPRVYSKTQNEYTGKDRKRGAITSLVNAIKGERSAFECLYGDLENFENTKFILALDADSELPLLAAKGLISAALHPLNKPVIDENKGKVVSGYGIFAPCVGTDLAFSSSTFFSSLLSGSGGITAYDNLTSDRYQDIFGAGIFAGKGLINVDVFYTLLSDRFKNEKILSHDILEGEFMRTLFVSDVEVADGFPSNEDAYLSRLHRWVRGDWQNLPFLLKYPYVFSEKEKNPLDFVSRFKLFDNLRRSVTPVFSLLLILISVSFATKSAAILISIGLLSACASELFGFISALFSGGIAMLSRLYYGNTLPAALAKLLTAAVNIIMLPQTAFKCADAIVRAVYRQVFSKKNMLEWVTAADSEKSGSFSRILIKNIPSFLCALWLIAFGKPYGILCAVLFLSNFLFSYFSGQKEKAKSESIGFLAKEKLVSLAAAQWNYYEKYCGENDSFLPPDNVQETPVFRIAHRTSPTNIGLMLCCTIAARDFCFIDTNEMYFRLNKAFESIEKLEKWHGNLLNWYDTETLSPLEPKYASTVDSGNFLCCLTALRQGLYEYCGEKEELKDIIKKIDGIIDETDLSPLFNRQRKLFHIGFDLTKNSLSPSYYDLLMSEARMTSYYAVSNESVTKKHWGMLGRTIAKCGRYTGPVSWSGTMFEYFMPNIFLPAFKNTLSYEGLRFCLYCQENRTKKAGLPWGISESGFFAFDAMLNYQYKAHGVKKLGLNKSLDSDTVISPYSTFLALPFAFHKAFANIKQLEKLNITGDCGFYEAADFTKSRNEGQDYSAVRSFMAHHIGMSMLSVLNTLYDFRMQKLFMRDEKMAGGKALLEEKVPTFSPVFSDIDLREKEPKAEKPSRSKIEIANISPLTPKVKIFTNGEWTSIVSDCGASASLYRNTDVLRRTHDLLSSPNGVAAAFRYDGKTLPFTKFTDYSDDGNFKALFEDTAASFDNSDENIIVGESVCVHPRKPSEQRKFTVRNNSKKTVKGKLLIYFEPSLTPYKKEKNHPAFSKLFVTESFENDSKTLLFTLRSREKENSLCACCGILEDIPFSYSCSREKVLDRPDGIFSFLRTDASFHRETGTPDCCCAISVPLKIQPREKKTVTLFVCASSSENEAFSVASSIRREGIINESKASPSPFPDSSADGIVSVCVLPEVIFGMNRSPLQTEAAENNKSGVNMLWSMGISGDNPIIAFEIKTENDVKKLAPFIRVTKRLRYSSIRTDLVIAFSEGGDYSSPIKKAVLKVLQSENSADGHGGIFTVNLKECEDGFFDALIAFSAYFCRSGETFVPASFKPYLPVKFLSAERGEIGENGVKDNGYFINEKPLLPWSFVLANPKFGTLVTDCSIGYTWALNSSLNKITPWSNDTRYDLCGEKIILETDGKYFDLANGASVFFAENEAVYSGSADNIKFVLTVCVPENEMKKEIRVSLSCNEKRDVKIIYMTEPVLSDKSETNGLVNGYREENSVVFFNPASEFSGKAKLAVTGKNSFALFDKADFLSGNWDSDKKLPRKNPVCSIGRKIRLSSDKNEEFLFSLEFIPDRETTQLRYFSDKNKISVRTPDKELNELVNLFLPTQIIKGRMDARTGFYQCGGAFGFRDQLQDALSLVILSPERLKYQILLNSSMQFKDGDVMHWYHILPDKIKGVRTRYSDDLLWLPYAVGEYISATGDREILDTEIPFVEGEVLKKNEKERYFETFSSTDAATLYEHCTRALEHSLNFGAHSLPLMMGGDWNDGFNAVGEKGKGESVWLAQFLSMTLEKFAPYCDDDKKSKYIALSEKLKDSVDKCAWNGEWYVRAFFDDGSPMGTKDCKECQIDSLPQSFAVFCNMPSEERKAQALSSAVKYLADRKNGLVKLFSDGFKNDARAGYVSSYPVGLRENGGQYTHAAVWLSAALIESMQTDEGYSLLRMLNPLVKYLNNSTAEKYKTEPYFLDGDVYSKKGSEGRGGWSLYTGSAGWYYKTVIEDILGIKKKGDKIFVSPSLPSSWDECQAEILFGKAKIEITVVKDTADEMTVDGKNALFAVLDENNHKIIVKYSGK